SMMIPGSNLSVDRASSARLAYEKFMDNLCMQGDADKGMDGLLDYTGITATGAQADGTGLSPDWYDKDGVLILRDVNDTLTGAYVDSLTVEIFDTILLPVSRYTLIANKRLGDTEM